MSQLARDSTGDQTIAMLGTLAVATQRLLDTVDALDPAAMSAPSRLPGWTRGTVVAHLAYGARATVRMLRQPAGHMVAFYPGGPDQRVASLALAERLSRDELARLLGDACHDLGRAAADLPSPAWEATVTEPRLGAMARSRLVVLRLTEVEVHHTDLGCEYTPLGWSSDFVDVALPLRLSWLGSHHRDRPEADLDVNGRWRVVRTDTGQRWIVRAEGRSVSVVEDSGRDDAQAEFRGASWQLLAFLLGRGQLGRRSQADQFKRAFPGP